MHSFNRKSQNFKLPQGGRLIAKKTHKKKPRELKLTPAQIESLGSPVRVDLYEALRKRRQASVVELAVDLERSVHSLYYHVKSLTKVGLIRVCEYRRVGKRDEAVFEPVSSRLVIDRENNNAAYVESLIKTVRLALRKAEQEHRNARQAESPSDLFAVLRLQANLSTEDGLTLQKKLKALGQWVRNRDQSTDKTGTQQISLTCLAVPLTPSF